MVTDNNQDELLMYLNRRKTSAGVYLYLMESFREDGQVKKRIVESFGKEELLPKEKIKELELKYGPAKQATIQEKRLEAVNRHISLLSESFEDENYAMRSHSAMLHYGHLILSKLWEQELKLSYKINYLQTKKTKIEAYSVNNIAFFLTALKLIDPASNLKAFENQTSFLCNPIEGILIDNIYAGLDFMGNYKEDIMKYVCKSLQGSNFRSKPRMLFYDCTNCYFEAPYDDRELFRIKFIRDRRKELHKNGFADEEISKIIESDNFKIELALAEKKAEDDGYFMRMRGVSKEQRYDLPLISVALVIDDRGIPLDFEVYEGNCSEFTKMPENMAALKKKYDVQDIYMVADRGLNSTGNLNMLLEQGMGFIVAQKVSNQTKKIRDMMLDEKGWKPYRAGADEKGNIYNAATEHDELGIFDYKICDFEKTSRVPDPNNPEKTKVLKVKCKIMFTFDKKRQERDLKKLEEELIKANEAINNKQLMGRNGGAGWRSLVNTTAEEDKKKEIYRASSIKESVVKERKTIAGYSAIVFSPSKNDIKADNWIEDIAILNSYHQLVKIEECFRIMKSNFSIRPMFVRLGRRIIGHCLICVLALVMIRMIEIKLASKGWSIFINKICEALYDAEVRATRLPGGKFLYLACNHYREIYSLASMDKRNKHKSSDINSMADIEEVLENYKQAHKDGNDLIKIMQALDLKPLQEISTVGELANRLRILIKNDEQAVGKALNILLS